MNQMLDKLSKFLAFDKRSEDEKAAERRKIEQKVDRKFKAGEIGCFFSEIVKIQQEREALIKQRPTKATAIKELSAQIAEGLVDLEKEIQAFKRMLETEDLPTDPAEEYLQRWCNLRVQEDSQGHSQGGKVSLQLKEAELSELQDLSVL